ncbi:Protein HID1 [Trichinella britovi]|uniref:Protein HID1 n=1 Tax=Trichinella britovi TaxID=45882 RepID=A0A0V1D435_TRIBR|nr:Protein HID1 [Trichinella britovi]KRY56135.1 Protein HID1 [Trichinella britovi]
MGGSDSKLNFRKAVVELTSTKKSVEPSDDVFWEQFWQPNSIKQVQDIFSLIQSEEIRQLREHAPNNLATLCYKAVERLSQACQTSSHTVNDQQEILNCARILTRLLPFIFEDPDWRGYFWSNVSTPGSSGGPDGDTPPLGKLLLNSLCDLLFCPDFTVSSSKKGPETVENLKSIDSCEYIWEAGIGFAISPPHNPQYDCHRTELLRLLLTCLSDVMYQSNAAIQSGYENFWLTNFTSAENRHVLPLFTSLMNVVFSYDPIGYGLPYNHLLFSDCRGPLVEVALQVLVATLDQNRGDSTVTHEEDEAIFSNENLFISYLSRVHRDEDFEFILRGFSRLLNNPLTQTYLPNSCKKVAFHQELLVLFWKCCDYNRKFLFHVLKSSAVLDILVPILYYLNDSRNDQTRAGLVHMGVFVILLLSGERNFGVRLNKSYTARVAMDIPLFTGTHADLLIIVFHKLITSGNGKLQSLFECLLTIIVNVSPYLKSMSMVAASKLLHLLEVFSTPWYLYAAPNNHHMVFFLLEIFNNIIQYQFDGNYNLVYTIIRKRQVFYQLANLASDDSSISVALKSRKRQTGSKNTLPDMKTPTESSNDDQCPDQGGQQEAGTKLSQTQEGTAATAEEEAEAKQSHHGLSASLAKTPNVNAMTERGASGLQEGVASLMLPTSNKAGSSKSDSGTSESWTPTQKWVDNWKQKLPMQTVMRLLQVLVPQVEKICIDRMLTDEGEVLKFLQHGTLVGLLPVPHPILIRKYQSNSGTNEWFRIYLWGVIYLRNTDPPIWYDSQIQLFEIQKI